MYAAMPIPTPRPEKVVPMVTERFGCRLKRLREASKLTQEELAQQSGVGRTTIAKLESGERAGLSAGALVLLARALNLPIDELVKDTVFS